MTETARGADACRRFQLIRHEDETGVSGTGVVAYGVLFPDGRAVLRWDTKVNSTVFYESVADLEAIHGHGGKTVIHWLDTDMPPIAYSEPGRALTGYAELADVITHLPILVRERRRQQGLSVRAAAKEIGMSFSTISRLESGEDLNSGNLAACLRWLDRPAPTREESR